MDVVTVLFLCFFTLFADPTFGEDINEDLAKIDAIHPEPPCESAGGICTIAADCPAGHLSEIRGLCPAQKNKGIECCHGLSMKETRCTKHGGACLTSKEFCNPRQVYLEATDCPSETTCCIMIA